MKHIIRKWFWAWDFDKEEKWLNEMSSKGLHLTGVSFCRYVFEEGNPGEYAYRLELLDNMPSHVQSIQYIKFLEDTGVEEIGSLLRWVYFRKKVEFGSFDLYSDIDSRIKHLNRILLLIIPLLIMELCIGLNNVLLYSNHGLGGALYGGLLCLVVAALMAYGSLKIWFKKSKLKKERLLHE